MDYYSAIKNNAMMLFAKMWMDLEIVIVSKDTPFSSICLNTTLTSTCSFSHRSNWKKKKSLPSVDNFDLL